MRMCDVGPPCGSRETAVIGQLMRANPKSFNGVDEMCWDGFD